MPAGPPWMLRVEHGRKRGIICEHCGIPWPGHELPTPHEAKRRNPGFGALPAMNPLTNLIEELRRMGD